MTATNFTGSASFKALEEAINKIEATRKYVLSILTCASQSKCEALHTVYLFGGWEGAGTTNLTLTIRA